MDPMTLEHQCEIDGRYFVALAARQDARGTVRYDLTPEQFARLRVVETTVGCPENAPRLVFARLLYQTGRLTP